MMMTMMTKTKMILPTLMRRQIATRSRSSTCIQQKHYHHHHHLPAAAAVANPTKTTVASTRIATTDNNHHHHNKPILSTATIRRSFSSSDSSNDSPPSTNNNCDVVQGPSLLRTSLSRPSPNLMILPGLRSLPFWTSPDYKRIAYGDPLLEKIIKHLEDNVDEIRDEFITNSKNLKSDYEGSSSGHNDKLHKGNWDWFSYLNKGSVQGHFAYNFPKTAKVLQELRSENLLFEGTPFGFCFFSVLGKQSSIEAHTAPMNLRLRIHLPLIVPTDSVEETDDSNNKSIKCGIRVGPIERPWTKSKAMVLDDSYNHEVWNNTNEKRVLLLVDIWHPDISHQEKYDIVEMFQNAKQQGLWKR